MKQPHSTAHGFDYHRLDWLVNWAYSIEWHQKTDDAEISTTTLVFRCDLKELRQMGAFLMGPRDSGENT